MPGLLKKNALCPKCHTPLEAIVSTRHGSNGGETVEYFHQKGYRGRKKLSWKTWRKVRCKVFYEDPATAPDLDQHRTAA
jgi:hypothetical protein